MACNMAFYGASIDNTIVSSTPQDLLSQVEKEFQGHYCKDNLTEQDWDSETSLFVIWIGINECVLFSHCTCAEQKD